MYYTLNTGLSLQAGYIEEKANTNISHVSGGRIDSDKLTLNPWPFTIEPDVEEGLKMSDFYSAQSLMSNRLVKMLRETHDLGFAARRASEAYRQVGRFSPR